MALSYHLEFHKRYWHSLPHKVMASSGKQFSRSPQYNCSSQYTWSISFLHVDSWFKVILYLLAVLHAHLLVPCWPPLWPPLSEEDRWSLLIKQSPSTSIHVVQPPQFIGEEIKASQGDANFLALSWYLLKTNLIHRPYICMQVSAGKHRNRIF